MTLKRVAALCRAAAFLLVGLGTPATAQDLSLRLPVDCKLGKDCFIQQYVDHDPGRGAKDYRCAPLSYNRHSGTDFALATVAQMQAGVNVIAAAPGTVARLRDGMHDRFYSAANAETVTGRECGNFVVLTHPGGWETQYCHLKRDTVVVRRGARVRAGQVLGKIGMSGRAQFPHLHLTVRRNGEVVDPFDPDGQLICGAPSIQTLWSKAPAYYPGGLIDISFAPGIPDYMDVKSGRARHSTLPADTPTLVLYGYAFGGQRGDTITLRITGPKGDITKHSATLEKNLAQFFRAAGTQLSGPSWPEGRYSGTVTMTRNGRVISKRSARLTLR